MLAYRTHHPAILATFAALVLAGVLWLVPTVARAQLGYAQKPAPWGLAAVIRNDPAQPLDPKPFRNPHIRGVVLQIHWSDIEPAEGKTNWARLDELFAAAQTSHKWVHLLIFPGFWSPPWALQRAEIATFNVQYGPGKGQPKPLPMPWDPAYLGNWFAFLTRVGAAVWRSPRIPDDRRRWADIGLGGIHGARYIS